MPQNQEQNGGQNRQARNCIAQDLVCAQCGYVWLDAAVSQEIDKIIKEHRRPEKYERVGKSIRLYHLP